MKTSRILRRAGRTQGSLGSVAGTSLLGVKTPRPAVAPWHVEMEALKSWSPTALGHRGWTVCTLLTEIRRIVLKNKREGFVFALIFYIAGGGAFHFLLSSLNPALGRNTQTLFLCDKSLAPISSAFSVVNYRHNTSADDWVSTSIFVGLCDF